MFSKRPAKARMRGDFISELEGEGVARPEPVEHRDSDERVGRRRWLGARGRAWLASDDGEPAREKRPLGFDGDPKHMAKLKDGVAAWNEWRKDNPAIEPDLRGADFTKAEDWQGTKIWGRPQRDEGGPERALLGAVDFSRAELSFAKLSGADLWGAKLSGAVLFEAKLNDTEFSFADLSGAKLRFADFRDADVSFITYDPKRLKGRCYGIRAETCYGNARFKRDVMDQDYLDQAEDDIWNEVRIPYWSLLDRIPWLGTLRWWLVASFTGFFKRVEPRDRSEPGHRSEKGALILNWPPLALGLLIGLILVAIVLHSAPSGAHRVDGVIASLVAAKNWHLLWPILLAPVFGTGYLAGTAGRLTMFWIWGWFDFGRSWQAVLLFAFLMISLFGGLYLWLDGSALALTGEAQDHAIWFYPWFVALMGFATLGISGYVAPLSGLGALIIMANVLSGFMTLGLLLSVLGNIFARRA